MDEWDPAGSRTFILVHFKGATPSICFKKDYVVGHLLLYHLVFTWYVLIMGKQYTNTPVKYGQKPAWEVSPLKFLLESVLWDSNTSGYT